jgi:hypothetical protein
LPGRIAPGQPVAQPSLCRTRRPVARPSDAEPSRSVARPPRPCGPPAGAVHPREVPVSRFLSRPRSLLRVVPVSDGEVFLLPRRGAAQGFEASPYEFLRRPHAVHRTQVFIRNWSGLSTGLFTALPQVTAGDSGNTLIEIPICNRLVIPATPGNSGPYHDRGPPPVHPGGSRRVSAQGPRPGSRSWGSPGPCR